MLRTQSAKVGRIEIEWDEAGNGGRPFVLVHGFTGSRDDWSDVIGELSAHGRTLTPDQRGHGGSSNPGDPGAYSLGQLVEDLAGFLDAAEVPVCDLLGHSMGGMVAMRLALEQPERVASLVLMDTAPGPVDVIPKAVLEMGAQLARAQGSGALVAPMRAAAANDPKRAAANRRAEQVMGPERYWERIQRKLDAMDAEAFATLGAELADHPPVTRRLSTLRRPTTIIVGAEDRPFLEPAHTMAECIDSAHLEIIPDAAHSPQMENREAWLAAIGAHLTRARA